MVRETGHNLKEMWSNGKNRVYAKTQQKLRIVRRIAKQKGEEIWDNTATYVRKNPGKSIAFSLGLGFLVGFLSRRPSRD